jgi:hypothetical protein
VPTIIPIILMATVAIKRILEAIAAFLSLLFKVKSVSPEDDENSSAVMRRIIALIASRRLASVKSKGGSCIMC